MAKIRVKRSSMVEAEGGWISEWMSKWVGVWLGKWVGKWVGGGTEGWVSELNW